jgi:ubiquinone/menaquinone biosynthesis C-methylase UbiE
MGSFGAETAKYYARYRRGYPDAVVDAVTDLLRLDSGDVVVDLGCGTGLLTRPFARRVGMVIGVDPEADLLAVARQSTEKELIPKLVWVLGSDADLPTTGKLVGDQRVGAVTVGQALHFMDYEKLFRTARPFLRVGGGIAVIATGIPLWQQASESAPRAGDGQHLLVFSVAPLAPWSRAGRQTRWSGPAASRSRGARFATWSRSAPSPDTGTLSDVGLPVHVVVTGQRALPRLWHYYEPSDS